MMGTLEAASEHSIRNKAEIGLSAVCGCYYCGRVFTPSEIERWLGDEGTALCPNCQIDSVLGDASGFPVTDPEFLTAMRRHCFLS